MSLVAWLGVGTIAPCCRVKVFIFLISPSVLPLVSFLFFLSCHFFSSHFPKNNSCNDKTYFARHTHHHLDLFFSSYYFILTSCHFSCFLLQMWLLFHQKNKYEKIVSSLSYIPMYVFFYSRKQSSQKNVCILFLLIIQITFLLF